VRTQLQLVATERTFAHAAAPGVEVEEATAFPDAVRGLFDRVAPTSNCIAVRDAKQLTWRFSERPGFDYRIALARRGGELVGLAVFTDGAFAGRACGLLCEWLVDPAAPEAGAALAQWGLERAHAAGREDLVTVVPDTHEQWLRLQALGFRAGATMYFPVARYFSKRHHPRWLFQNWYYTFADTDLV